MMYDHGILDASLTNNWSSFCFWLLHWYHFSSKPVNISQLVTNFCLAPIHSQNTILLLQQNKTKLWKAQQEILKQQMVEKCLSP